MLASCYFSGGSDGEGNALKGRRCHVITHDSSLEGCLISISSLYKLLSSKLCAQYTKVILEIGFLLSCKVLGVHGGVGGCD